MVLFFLILGIIILILSILIFSKIMIGIEKIDNINLKKQTKDFLLRISIYKYGFKIFKIDIKNTKIIELITKSIIKAKENKIKIPKKYSKKIKLSLKKANIKLEKLNLNIVIGTEDCILTAYLVGIISIIISNIIPHVCNYQNNLEEYNYNIIPVYNKNFSKLSLNCIISVKLVHIIYIIFLIWKGSRKDERSPNRKSYEYSYE